VIIKLNADEISALNAYESGPYGGESLHSFMAEMAARLKDDGTLDLDREDRERMQEYRLQGEAKCKRVDKVFKRAVEEAFNEFFE
jgi:hypothetical protein